MGEWNNPNDFISVHRIMKTEDAKEFRTLGRLKFNTPKNWVEYEKKYNRGIGDLYEGTLAFGHIIAPTDIIKLYNKYFNSRGDFIKKEFIEGRMLLKDEETLSLPCYCLYSMKVGDFTVPEKEGMCKVNGEMPSSFFRDFAKNKDKEYVKRLPINEQPAMVTINNFKEFIKRLKNRLITMGVTEEELLYKQVRYVDFEKYGQTGWMDLGTKFPSELFIKRKDFSYQNELRIIINTKNIKIRNEILKEGVCIGNIEDITNNNLYDYYDKGLNVIFEGNFIKNKE